MSGEEKEDDEAWVERQIEKVALFSLRYGQRSPDPAIPPVPPQSPYKVFTGAGVVALVAELHSHFPVLVVSFSAEPAPLGLGTRRGPNLQNFPVRSPVSLADQRRLRAKWCESPAVYGKPEPKPEGS